MEDWITLVLFSSIVFIVLAKGLFYSRFLNFIILPFNNKYIFLYNKKDKLMNWFHIFFTSFQLLNFALFIYLAITIYRPSNIVTSPILFTLLLAALILFLFLKVILQLGNSMIFNNKNVISEILFKKISYLNYSSLVMFFANILLTYVFIGSKTIFWMALILIIMIWIVGWATIIKTHQKIISSYFFYFILYLCALEIAPILIVVNSLKV